MHSGENLEEWIMDKWRNKEVMMSDFNIVIIPKLG